MRNGDFGRFYISQGECKIKVIYKLVKVMIDVKSVENLIL